MKRSRLLVVEDDPLLRDFLCDALEQCGYEVSSAAAASDALGLLESRLFDLAIVDVGLPDLDGVELLRRIKAHDPALEVVMMTGYPEVRTAVAALKLGAYDYLTKPVDADDLARLVARLLERNRLRQEVSELRSRLGERLTSQELVGASAAMNAIRAVIEQVAPSDSTVVIEGETGTGKELVAAAIHLLSARREQPFIPVNCGGIPAELVESEFFGHVRGAFSGAVADYPGLFRSAHGGTLFLDEVTELPAPLQVKLLRGAGARSAPGRIRAHVPGGHPRGGSVEAPRPRRCAHSESREASAAAPRARRVPHRASRPGIAGARSRSPARAPWAADRRGARPPSAAGCRLSRARDSSRCFRPSCEPPRLAPRNGRAARARRPSLLEQEPCREPPPRRRPCSGIVGTGFGGAW